MTSFTKSQIDRLGERLREGESAEDDLQFLNAYRLSFAKPFEAVIDIIRMRLQLKPTGRRVKSTISISDKLRRESIRLSQMQDIAGCRAIVSDVAAQNDVVERLTKLFVKTTLFDRRESPSYGYRAVHVVVQQDGMAIEVQVRTTLQHVWAELSEKLSDIADPAIKYGGGPGNLQSLLAELSATVADIEDLEKQLLTSQPSRSDPQTVNQIAASLAENKARLTESLENVIERIRSSKGI